MRLDQAIAARFPDVSRRKARELLSQHRVLVNERPVSVASRTVAITDRIVIVDEPSDLQILVSTDEWLAVNKPAGLAIQPDRERSRRSVEELLRLQLKRDETRHELYLVHRLDAGTSGVVVFARSRRAAAELSAAFAEGAMRKVYIAVVEGSLREPLTLDTPVREKTALTHVRPLRPSQFGTIVEAEPKTGRTHQIRVHLSSAGHPVVGDRRYGSTINAPRLMLHAHSLEHPLIGSVQAPVPPDFV
jgi:RluA family pseudouridine synthase